MKILFTGMTARHIGNARNQYMTEVEPLKIMMNYLGHTYEQRAVIVNEDLSEYDKIIVFLFPPEKMGATYRFGALDVLARYPEKCYVMFDDWQYYQFQMMMRSCLNSGRFWNWVDKNPGFMYNKDRQTILDGGLMIRNRIENIANILSENMYVPMIFAFFPWGDSSKIKVKTQNKIELIDLSWFAIDYINNNYNLDFPGKKEKAWVVGALFDQTKYISSLNLKWPVKYFGYRKTQPVLDEVTLCKVYQDNWGLVSHKNSSIAGDGWWRARWMHAYVCENIIHTFTEEIGRLPTDFMPPTKYIEEDAGETQLFLIQENQKNILEKNFDSREKTLTDLERILK